MNVTLFNQLTLPEKVVLIPINGRFMAQRQSDNHQVKLYYWANHFLEIYYRWPTHRGLGAHWEPYKVNAFVDKPACLNQLTAYTDQVNLSDLLQ